MAHNKYLTIWFLEDEGPISAKSTAQILSLNLTHTFFPLNFLITSLALHPHLLSFCLPLLILFPYQKPIHDVHGNPLWYSSFWRFSEIMSPTFQKLVWNSSVSFIFTISLRSIKSKTRFIELVLVYMYIYLLIISWCLFVSGKQKCVNKFHLFQTN